MAPHPILMHILHDDRTRELEAMLISQQRVEEWANVLAPALTWWARLVARITNSQAHKRGLPKGVAGSPVR